MNDDLKRRAQELMERKMARAAQRPPASRGIYDAVYYDAMAQIDDGGPPLPPVAVIVPPSHVALRRIARKLARAIRRDVAAWYARVRKARAQAVTLSRALRDARQRLTYMEDSDGSDSDSAWRLREYIDTLEAGLRVARRRAQEPPPTRI